MKMVYRKNTFAWKLVVVLVVMGIAVSVFVDCLAASKLAKGSTAYVNVETNLNLRKEPQGEIIGKAPRGEKVTIGIITISSVFSLQVLNAMLMGNI